MKEGKCTEIVLGVGEEKSMGTKSKKQFIGLYRKPSLDDVLHCFQKSGLIDEIWLVMRKE
ncbi:MAG: hypothetical protein HUJ74_00020 [Lachnospiraceae bacterium]|nr:hypothetical protein [Lachnospiraceae bacterium]